MGGVLEEIDCDEVRQPKLSPALLDKIADTFHRKMGRPATREDAQAWWDWIWPDFESYWGSKRYKSVSRAVQGWAARVRPHELDQAIAAREAAENHRLANEQTRLNEQADVTRIDYFAKRGR